MHIIFKNDKQKCCRLINSREQLIAACNSAENISNWNQYRQSGDEKYKRALVQVAYNCQVPDGGLLKGVQTVSPFFFYDIDCRDPKECRQIMSRLMEMKDELGLVEIAESASYGVHAVGRRRPGTTILENQVRISRLTRTEMDTNNKENNRVVFHGPIDIETTPLLDDALFTESLSDEEAAAEYQRLKLRESSRMEDIPAAARKSNKHYRPWIEIPETGISESRNDGTTDSRRAARSVAETPASPENPATTATPANLPNPARPLPLEGEMSEGQRGSLSYNGLPYTAIITKWWQMYNDGHEPVKSNRNTLTFELAVNLRHICGFDRDLLDRLIPCYDGFSQDEKMECIVSALNTPRTQMPTRLKKVLFEVRRDYARTAMTTGEGNDIYQKLGDIMAEDEHFYYNRLPKMPKGIKDSIEAVGPTMALPAVVAICPAIGALATGVRMRVDGKMNTLNLVSFVAGKFASGKSAIDPLINAWTSEIQAQDKVYYAQEEEWRMQKRAAKNKKEQPAEKKLPIRFLTLNNTVANLSERLANTGGLHAFSFTPEADVVSQKWKSTISDFSTMVRQCFDASPYEREARSIDAVNVHIDRLLWNITMCGTPDALYRLVNNNYSNGFQSRLAVASTPDNTFLPLSSKPFLLTDAHVENIRKVAHLLMLMKGDVTLSALDQKGIDWVNGIQQTALMNADVVMAIQRMRTRVVALRMTCCLMLCRVCEKLISQYGYDGAEAQLLQDPEMWIPMLEKLQNARMMETFDLLADYLLDTALFYFRERLENAQKSSDYDGSRYRRVAKNDSIYARLDNEFSMEAARQHSIAVKGIDVSPNQVFQMLKNWKKQGLILQTGTARYQKIRLDL